MESSSEIISPNITIGEQQCNQDEQQRPNNKNCCPSIVLSEGIIRAIFLLLGVGVLIPWNAFVSAKPYFTSRLCRSGQDIVNFEQWFGLLWNVFSVLSLGLVIARNSFSDYFRKNLQQPLANVEEIYNSEGQSNDSVGDRTTTSSTQDNSFHLVMIPLAIYATVFSIQAYLVIWIDISSTTFLIVIFVSLSICGGVCAMATAGIISIAGAFPSQIGIIPFFSGQSIGGVAVSVANFVGNILGEDPADFLHEHCKSSNHSYEIVGGYNLILSKETHRVDAYFQQKESSSCSPYTVMNWSVFCYFSLGCIILILCIVGYNQIHLYQSIKHRIDYEPLRNEIHDEITIVNNDGTFEVEETSPRIGLELNDRINQRQQIQRDQLSASSAFRDVYGNDDVNQMQCDEEETVNIVDPKSVFFAIKGPAICVFLTFTVTLTLFPSWISELKSVHECTNRYRLVNDLFVPFCFVLFNFGDLLGRLVAEYVPVERINNLSKKLIVAAVLRFALLPVFLVCLTNIGEERNKVIRSDIFSLFVQLFFAVTNGLFVSISFMLSPKLVGTSTGLQESASEIMTLSLYLGLLCGSFLSFPFIQAATHILN